MDGSGIFLFDAGPSSNLQRFLTRNLDQLRGANGLILPVKALFYSHTDRDHIGNIPVLAQLKPESVWAGAFHNRNFIEIHNYLCKLHQQGVLQYNCQLRESEEVPQPGSGIKIEVVGPLKQFGGNTLSHAHNRCAVFRLSRGNKPLALIPGDLSSRGLKDLLRAKDLKADLLIYPHHGGRPGHAEPEKFARRLMDAVESKHVFFSVAPGSKLFPRPAVARLIQREYPKVRILCTGVSSHCHASKNGRPFCCSPEGDFEYDLDQSELHAITSLAAHDAVIATLLTPLCRQAGTPKLLLG